MTLTITGRHVIHRGMELHHLLCCRIHHSLMDLVQNQFPRRGDFVHIDPALVSVFDCPSPTNSYTASICCIKLYLDTVN